MKVSGPLWKDRLDGSLPADFAQDIDAFESELQLRSQEKLAERIFAENRLRRGVYGQRYDNGRRHDGEKVQELAYPHAAKRKGPDTVWDAPGMQRIKIPYGGVNAEQLEALADLAEEYADGIVHITTRQDFQLHFVHIEDTPTLMRRLAAVGITTREACGNVVRNVTACPYAGACRGEAFDVTPYADALSRFLLFHPDCQDFGRKFKPAFSGCAGEGCGLVRMHDLGLQAVKRIEGGREVKGFEVYVGGGLGAVPHQAKVLEPFLPPDELLPMAQAMGRVFARLGEKKNRNRARLKFLVKDLGIDKFRELVREERQRLPHDPRWAEWVRESEFSAESPTGPPGAMPAGGSEPFGQWLQTNVRPQRQEGYGMVTVALPLGDITPHQLRGLADIARRFNRETIRTTVEQNFVIRWIGLSDLPELYSALDALGLAEPSASTILDIVACPGTDTCKLGISSSRGLAAELRTRLAEASYNLDSAVRDLHIKVSGCFNSCGQHHVADLGFYGVTRKIEGYQVPHFQVILGGQWSHNAGSFGLPIIAIPAKHVPEAVTRITSLYVAERSGDESFQDFIQRVGKVRLRGILEDLTRPLEDSADRSFFRDWGDPREFSIRDIGNGECAGQILELVEFGLAAAERQVFDSQVALEGGDAAKASRLAYEAMVHAARSLVRTEVTDVVEHPDRVVDEFRARFFDTKRFFDPYAGGKFANYLFAAHSGTVTPEAPEAPEAAHHRIEEAQLFIEAAHSCYNRMSAN